MHWGRLVSHAGVEESTLSSRGKGFIKAETANTWHWAIERQKPQTPGILEQWGYFGHRSRGLNNFLLSVRIFYSPLLLVTSSNLRTTLQSLLQGSAETGTVVSAPTAGLH